MRIRPFSHSLLTLLWRASILPCYEDIDGSAYGDVYNPIEAKGLVGMH